jgi:tRNA modification GTPase
VWNKVDLAALTPALSKREGESLAPSPSGGGLGWGHASAVSLSAKTGEGLDALRAKLLAAAGWQSAPEGVYIARERHLQALFRVQTHLGEASAHLATKSQALELLAEELRLAQNALNEITGEFSSDDLLGVIFSSFCIGK